MNMVNGMAGNLGNLKNIHTHTHTKSAVMQRPSEINRSENHLQQTIQKSSFPVSDYRGMASASHIFCNFFEVAVMISNIFVCSWMRFPYSDWPGWTRREIAMLRMCTSFGARQ